MNYASFLDDLLDSGQVSVHRKEISRLSSDGIRFSDGTVLATDAIVHATGWNWCCPIEFIGIDCLDFGIPTPLKEPRTSRDMCRLYKAVDASIVKQFPYLRQAPPQPSKSAINQVGGCEDGLEYTSWRLYRAIAPPSQVVGTSKRDLVFLGMFNTYAKSLLSEVQALWAVVYLEGLLEIKRNEEEVTEEITLWSRWARLRYPFGHGAKYPDTAFDIVPYFDVLLTDLGLRQRRKNTWWREIWEPYGPRDYSGLLDEFVQKMGAAG
jgi:hypothetical protein